MANDDFVNDIMRIVIGKAIEIAPELNLDPAEVRETFKREHPEWVDLRKDEIQ